MAVYQQIIILARNGSSQRSIAKNLGLSRTTVQSHLRTYRLHQEKQSAKQAAEGIVHKPKYDSSKRKRSKLTEELVSLIEDCLAKNKAKLATHRGKQRMKAVDIHAYLLAEGHSISYSTITSYLRRHNRKTKEAFIRQSPEAGASTEFDWGEVKLYIKGQLTSYQLAVFTAAFSNHRFAVLFDRQDSSSFLQSHVHYFTSVGAVMQEMVYDNMRTAVAKFAVKNKDKQATDALLSLSAYYGFDFRFCNARKGNEKGHVERSVEFIRRKAFCIQDSFETLRQANEHLSKVVQTLNQRCVAGQQESIQARMDQVEIPLMQNLPAVPFDVGVLRQLRVDKYACVKVDCNYYSVPDHLVAYRLSVKVYPQYIKVYTADHRCVAQHQRRRTRHAYYLKVDHFLTTFRHKPGAFKGSLSLKQADQLTRALFEQYFKKETKLFIELLIFLKQKQLAISHLEKAIQQCLLVSPHQILDKDKLIFFMTEQARVGTELKQVRPQDVLATQINQQCTLQLETIQELFST